MVRKELSTTTVQVLSKTRERLGKFATKEETFDDAINRALDLAEARIAEVKALDP